MQTEQMQLSSKLVLLPDWMERTLCLKLFNSMFSTLQSVGSASTSVYVSARAACLKDVSEGGCYLL